MKDNYYTLLQKLDNFIKRYYRFKILKGILLFFTLTFGIVLSESIIEYYNYTSVNLRTFLFYFSIFIFLLIIVYFIILPTLSLFKLRNRLNLKSASNIISKHFQLVDDNLINTIELGKDIEKNHNKTDLLIASIEQRTKLLNPIPFNFAIPINNLKRPFIYFVISIFIVLSIFSFAPAIFNEGAYRIIDYNNYYEPAAPFSFVVENSNLFVKKGDDFVVHILLEGDYIPDEVSISIGGNNFLMFKKKNTRNQFQFKIKNLNNSISIYFVADKFKSKNYRINVLEAPVLKNFSVKVIPPKYTGISQMNLINSGDLKIPFGSVVHWKFSTSFVDSLLLFFDNDTINCKLDNKIFTSKKQITKSGKYSLFFKNENFTINNDITYQINVVADLFPQINVNSVEDSLEIGIYYYMVNVKDDYGFSKLNLKYRIVEKSNSTNQFKSKNIEIVKNNRNQDVFYNFNFNSIELNSENEFIEYFFEIYDNDYISGFKSTKSKLNIYKPFSRLDIKNSIVEKEKSVSRNLDESKKLIEDIKKDIEDFKRKELNSKLNEWEKKNFLKNISIKQKELNKLIDKINKDNSKKNNLNNQIYPENEKILEKQKQIQDILNELMDQELKDLLEEIQKLQNKFNDKEFDKLKDKMNLSYDELDKDLEKSLELLKRFQVEEKMDNLSEDLKNLSNDLEKLSKIDYKKDHRDDQKFNQKRINDKFKDLQKEFKNTLEKNTDLKRPFNIDNFDKDFEEINKKLENIKNDIEKKSDKKINKGRKDASDTMEKLSNKMKKAMEEMNSQSLNMNMQDLRQIIENLNIFSFTQEDVYLELNKIYSNDPKFSELINQQNKLSEDFKLIEDSLNSLASRVPQMSNLISKELSQLKFSLNKTLSEFELHHRRASIRYQRNVINSANTLALYLEELNDQLQNQQSQSSSGKGDPNKPSNSMQKLKQQQEGLKKQLEQLLEELKKNGGKKSGNGVNKATVKSLAQQEIFNKMLNEMQNSEGITPEMSKKLKEIKRLSDKNIEDLINMNISRDLLDRNQSIKTRLLEAENAERERKKEKIRESNEGKNVKRKFPKEIEEYLLKNSLYRESLHKNNINLNKYFQNLSNDYYQRIK